MCDPQTMKCGTTTLCVAAALLLAGCIGDRLGARPEAQAPTPVAAPATPGLAMVAGAAAGESARVHDPDLGGPAWIDVLSIYSAASGRTCKQVQLRRDGGAPLTRVACAGAGGWYWTPASIT